MTKDELLELIATNIPTNGNAQVTAAKERQVMEAVVQYASENPGPKGDKGDTGDSRVKLYKYIVTAADFADADPEETTDISDPIFTIGAGEKFLLLSMYLNVPGIAAGATQINVGPNIGGSSAALDTRADGGINTQPTGQQGLDYNPSFFSSVNFLLSKTDPNPITAGIYVDSTLATVGQYPEVEICIWTLTSV